MNIKDINKDRAETILLAIKMAFIRGERPVRVETVQSCFPAFKFNEEEVKAVLGATVSELLEHLGIKWAK